MNQLFAMIGAHALADYPLQGDFLAKAKNRTAPIPGVPWYQALGAHAIIHGAAVAAITRSPALGLAETAIHAITDDLKCLQGAVVGPRHLTLAIRRGFIMTDERVKCEACGTKIPVASSHTDGDGFTGCRPCFPVSNKPEDSNRFLRGPCARKNAAVPS